MTGHVFVTYAARDATDPYVLTAVAYLVEAGLAVHAHQEAAADEVTQATSQLLDACGVVVPVITAATAGSIRLRLEVEYALAAGKPIRPLLLAGDVPRWLKRNPVADVTDRRLPPPAFVDELRRLAGAPPRRSLHDEPLGSGTARFPELPLITTETAPVDAPTSGPPQPAADAEPTWASLLDPTPTERRLLSQQRPPGAGATGAAPPTAEPESAKPWIPEPWIAEPWIAEPWIPEPRSEEAWSDEPRPAQPRPDDGRPAQSRPGRPTPSWTDALPPDWVDAEPYRPDDAPPDWVDTAPSWSDLPPDPQRSTADEANWVEQSLTWTDPDNPGGAPRRSRPMPTSASSAETAWFMPIRETAPGPAGNATPGASTTSGTGPRSGLPAERAARFAGPRPVPGPPEPDGHAGRPAFRQPRALWVVAAVLGGMVLLGLLSALLAYLLAS